MSSSEAIALVQSIQAACHSWQAFDWSGKQRTVVDQTLLTSKEAREQSVNARKGLADTTKQFKKSIKSLQMAAEALEAAVTPENATSTVKAFEGVFKESKGIVNLYKEEIDNLTRRCKNAETAFASLAQSLMELPDPAAVLPACTEQLQLQQDQVNQLLQTLERLNNEMEKQQENHKKELLAVKQNSSAGGGGGSGSGSGGGLSKQEREELLDLRREVAEYEVEFRSLKNQDITIRKLEARIAELQSNAAEQFREQLEKAREELVETEGRRAAEALEREAAMERKLQALELQLRAERAGREATQVHFLEADEGVSRREAAWEAQRQILMDDSERLRESLQVATRERDELRLKVAALQGGSGGEGKKSNLFSPPSSVSMDDLLLERSAYEAEVAELSETANLLREEVRIKEDALAEEKRISQAKIEALEREKSTLQSNIVSLEAQVAAAPSLQAVENMKRELRILKRLEYNAHDVDADRDPEIAGQNIDEDQDLDSVLVAKLRRAESELVTERVARTELTKECNVLRKSLSESDKIKNDLEKLVASLEKDLAKAIASPFASDGTTTTAEHALASGQDALVLQSVLDPNAPAVPRPTPTVASKSSSSMSAAERADDDHSVATIVMAQRDRLRARCEALEAERDSFKRELQAQVSASESLKSDNAKLYEKVRYLQSFNKGSSSSSSNYNYNRDHDLDLEALEQRYEASVDPFRQFSRAERQRKLNEMSPTERTVFVVAKTVLATKEMRTALFFYVLILHMLVFVTTYHWSHADICDATNFEHLSHLPPNPAAHVREEFQAAAKTAD